MFFIIKVYRFSFYLPHRSSSCSELQSENHENLASEFKESARLLL